MAEVQAWVGGRLVAWSQASVSVFDRGFRTGEGVFETIRAYGTHPFRLEAHLSRAASGAQVLGLALPRDVAREAVTSVVAANVGVVGRDSAVRLTVTPGVIDATSPHPGTPIDAPTVVATSASLEIDEQIYRTGVAAAVVPLARELPQIKAVSYLSAALARRRAQEQGAFEALLTDPRGLVLEGSASNVFVIVRGRLVTPPVEAGLLAGVTREVVLKVAGEQGLPVEQRPITLQELMEADEVLLTQSTREVVPVVRVSGRRIGDGRPGPITSGLHEGYRAEVRDEMEGSGSA